MAELLKDSIFSKQTVSELSAIVKKHLDLFDEKNFLTKVFNSKWKDLELKQRMRHITECLHKEMNLPYKKSIQILNQVSDEYSGFAAMVLADYVELYGLDDIEISKKALKKYTSCCSSEFAVRPFIIKYPEEMMNEMCKWSRDKNYHVRRLASEGCRPRLPWAIALPEFKKNPLPIIPILEELRNDDSEYVRKSVANNINDISKDNPELVLAIAEKWYGETENTNWIIKHGLRTLLKNGNERALSLFNISKDINAEIHNLKIENDKIKIGSKLKFQFDVKNNEKTSHNFRLEFRIEFPKANGKLSGKTFKVSEVMLQAGEIKNYKRSFDFKNRTTRKLYAGIHTIKLMVNGIEKEKFDIILEK